MDLAAIRTAIRERMGIPATDGLYTDAQLTNHANAALHHLEMQSDWPWLEKTDAALAAAASVALPADHLRTIYIARSGYPPLERREAEFVRAIPADAGIPFFYAIESGNLLIRGTGAATLTHFYIRTEPDLVAGTDTPLVPANYRPAIVEYAAHLAFRRSGQLNEAKVALADFGGWLTIMLERHGRKSASEGGGVLPVEAAAKP